MAWYYAQHIAVLAIDAALFSLIALRLLTPPTRSGPSDGRTRGALGLVCTAIGFLLVLHLSRLGLDLVGRNFGGGILWRWLHPISSTLSILLYGGFGICMAFAIKQFAMATSPEATVKRPPHLSPAGPDDSFRSQPSQQPMDWGYLGKQIRIGFFRLIGFLLLLGAAPLAFVQRNPGVGIMALATGLGCLWLGFHPKSPLAIKYASLAEDDASAEEP